MSKDLKHPPISEEERKEMDAKLKAHPTVEERYPTDDHFPVSRPRPKSTDPVDWSSIQTIIDEVTKNRKETK